MANMSYCRFRNTRLDVEDCLDALREEKRLSGEEACAGRRMFEDILEFCRDNDIISGYDSGVIEDIFDNLSKKEGESDER